MKRLIILLSLVVIILYSCKKDIPINSSGNKIIGKWNLIKLLEFNYGSFSTFNTDSIIYKSGAYIDFRTDGKAYYFTNNTPSTSNIQLNEYDTSFYKYNDSIGYIIFWKNNTSLKDSFTVNTINQSTLDLYKYSNYGWGYLKTWLYCNR